MHPTGLNLDWKGRLHGFNLFGLASSPKLAADLEDSQVVRLSRLTHVVVAPKVPERLSIKISDFDLQGCEVALSELWCKAYVGPLALATKDGRDCRLDKSRFIQVQLNVRDGVAKAVVDVGVPESQETWAIRLKLYRRRASSFFLQQKVLTLQTSLPRPEGNVDMSKPNDGASQPRIIGGSAKLEVLRLVDKNALQSLRVALGKALVEVISTPSSISEVRELLHCAQDLGPDTWRCGSVGEALIVAAGRGHPEVVLELLSAGVPPSIEAAWTAEKTGHLSIAHSIFARVPWDHPLPLLTRAMQHGMPLLAEYVLSQNPSSLVELKAADGAAAKMARATGCWTVLAALLDRGDPMPAPACALLDYALLAGHVGLARACLARCDGLEEMEHELKSCLGRGRFEIVREALEAQWRFRAKHWTEGEGPAFLSIERCLAEHPVECPVCFEPLHQDPGVMLNEKGLRACRHYICVECAEHLDDEAARLSRVWTARRDAQLQHIYRIPHPRGPTCPLCRAQFSEVKRLPNPTVDPRNFFRLSCVNNDPKCTTECTRLTEKAALSALCALLPLNATEFAPRLQTELWPAWTHNNGSNPQAPSLLEADFLRAGGMLAWLSDNLFELKLEEVRGDPPKLLDDPVAWFRYFDYDGKGRLTKPELLRGVAKAYNVAALAYASTPRSRARKVGVTKLRDLVEVVWDDGRWAEGVTLSDFECPGGLAERILAALPESEPQPFHSSVGDPTMSRFPMTVQEALAKARENDFQHCVDSLEHSKKRDEARKRAAGVVAPTPAADASTTTPATIIPAWDGLSTAQGQYSVDDSRRARSPSELRGRCPFCLAFTSTRGRAGNRIICTSCGNAFHPGAQNEVTEI